MGFKTPSEVEFAKMKERIIDYGNNVFMVPSATSGEYYLVDLSGNTCDCSVGDSGAPCKHKYVLWALKKGSRHNFLPIFSKVYRKRFAEIAIGVSLPEEFYEN